LSLRVGTPSSLRPYAVRHDRGVELARLRSRCEWGAEVPGA
jgi:hypothetical protein